MRSLMLLVAVAACTEDPVQRADHEVRRAVAPLFDVIAYDGPPAFDLGDLASAGPPGAPQLGGGGLGAPGVQGGAGGPSLAGGLGPPSGAGGGIASGPAGVAPDRTIVALACDLFDVLLQRVARCEGDPGGAIEQIDQLFHGEACEAYVEGVLRVSPQPLAPGAVAVIRCFTTAIRDAPCSVTPGADLLRQCSPSGG